VGRSHTDRDMDFAANHIAARDRGTIFLDISGSSEAVISPRGLVGAVPVWVHCANPTGSESVILRIADSTLQSTKWTVIHWVSAPMERLDVEAVRRWHVLAECTGNRAEVAFGADSVEHRVWCWTQSPGQSPRP